MTPTMGSFDPVFTRPLDTVASEESAALILRTFESAWSVYGILADTHGHVPVRDRYDRLWILVEVAAASAVDAPSLTITRTSVTHRTCTG
ncbi:hypothetical protein GCM10020255_012240 [Rhodococcus baikonurensis]